MNPAPMTTSIRPGTWTVDPSATTASFAVNELFTEVQGTIPVTGGRVEVGGSGSPLIVDAVLDISAIDTGKPRRDKDLRSKRFFDAERAPVMRYTSGSVTRTAEGWTVDGVLRVSGREVPLTLAVTHDVAPAGPASEEQRITATGRLDRRDAGIKAPSFLIGREVRITVSATLRCT